MWPGGSTLLTMPHNSVHLKFKTYALKITTGCVSEVGLTQQWCWWHTEITLLVNTPGPVHLPGRSEFQAADWTPALGMVLVSGEHSENRHVLRRAWQMTQWTSGCAEEVPLRSKSGFRGEGFDLSFMDGEVKTSWGSWRKYLENGRGWKRGLGGNRTSVPSP